jgi:FtsH-binding integral membrane protein
MAFGAMISMVAVRYSVAVVFHASVLVMVVLFCTSAFTLTARGAFPYFWAMLGSFVGITISCIFLGIYLPFPNAAQAICAISGAMLWTMFLLWDMAVIANYYSEDMWVLGAVTIYLDTLNILLFLLRFLGGRSRQ